MMRTMFASLNKKKSCEKVEADQPKFTKAVYRDELTKKRQPSKAVKKSVRFADTEPIILGEDDEKDLVKRSAAGEGARAGIRVKVKMTKEEAARLLSKCKEGGVLDFKDVARELVSVPVDRVSVVSSCTNIDPTIKAISQIF